jgi:3-oxoacyl-[acyl-carrier protein] reductase
MNLPTALDKRHPAISRDPQIGRESWLSPNTHNERNKGEDVSKLTGKIAVVTGASKGIGAGIAKAFAEAGATVVVDYASSKEDGDKVVSEIIAKGGNAVAIGASVAKAAEVTKLFDEVKKRFGRVDILVNNAGVAGLGPADKFSEEEFDREFAINVKGVFLATSAAAPLFPETGGAIINISSTYASDPQPMFGVYAATKGAIDTITKTHAKEFGPRNIRVNALCPGLIATEGSTAAGVIGSDFEKMVAARTPLRKIGKPEDVALPAVFLASDDARHITGASILVSGGDSI